MEEGLKSELPKGEYYDKLKEDFYKEVVVIAKEMDLRKKDTAQLLLLEREFISRRLTGVLLDDMVLVVAVGIFNRADSFDY